MEHAKSAVIIWYEIQMMIPNALINNVRLEVYRKKMVLALNARLMKK